MPDERQRTPRLRLFVALDPPERICAGVAAWAAQAFPPPAFRPLPAASLHVTLAFLGHLPEERAGEAAGLVAQTTPRRVEMRIRPDPAARPRRRPRLFALELEAPAAVELQGELAASLAAAELYEPERRDWWPHLTVARVRRERARASPPPLADALREPFDAVRLRLYRSKLRPQGAEYVPLASLSLPRGPDEAGAEER